MLPVYCSNTKNMKRYLKIPSEVVVTIDFTQSWAVSPFLSVMLNEKNIDEVKWSEDGTYGTVSYDTIEQTEPHTYSYISPETGKVTTHTLEVGTYGRPVFYDANTMTEISEEDVNGLIDKYDDYVIGKAYMAGDKFKYNGLSYAVIQAHTSQADWKPDLVMSLYKQIFPEEVIAEWVQPTGAQDAYNIGDQVLFNGSIYESLINANVWSPTAYPAGWKKLS